MTKTHKRRMWTEAECELLRRTYADTLTADLAEVLDRPLGTVHQKARKLGLSKDKAWVTETARRRNADPSNGNRRTRFGAGQPPWNKGQKGVTGHHPNTKANQFEPGHRPYTWVPIGSFRIVEGNVLEQKYADDPGPPGKRWKTYARLVWEREVGPIPEGMAVAFKPGHATTDPERITVDVLELLTRAQLMARNTVHTWPKPLAELVQLRGVLNRKINRKAKEAEKHE